MKLLTALFVFVFMGICSAADVTCYLNIVKNSCWNEYDVNIIVEDMTQRKPLSKVVLPKNTKWKRVSFNCSPGQTIHYLATFSPAFWEALKGKTYFSKQYWSLPSELTPGDVAWELTICFPKEFSGVPFPPTAGQDCKCQTNLITPLKLEGGKVSKPPPE